MLADVVSAEIPIFVWGALLGAGLVMLSLTGGFWYGKKSQKELNPEAQAEQVIKMLRGITDFTQGIAGDVSQHRERMKTLVGQLSEVEEAKPEDSTKDLLSEIAITNEALQVRLDQAELELKQQSQELAGYMSEARTDSLTDLPNRRAFDDDLAARFAQWRRYGTPISVLMIDIDHFKQFNDTYGHLAGDAVLGEVARVLRESMRRSDVVTRFGGEEFAIILPNTTVNDACIAAANMLRVLRETTLRYERKDLHVTVSCGVAQACTGDTSVSLIKRADEALYASKRNGRDRGHFSLGGELIQIKEDKPLLSTRQVVDVDKSQPVSAPANFSEVCDQLRRRLLEVSKR